MSCVHENVSGSINNDGFIVLSMIKTVVLRLIIIGNNENKNYRFPNGIL